MQLSCVACHESLSRAESVYNCPACGQTYPVRDGVVSVTAADYYYNTVPREQTRQFLSAAQAVGWDKAFYQLQSDRPREAESLFQGVLGFERAGWKYLLPLGPTRRALDIGCGWGAISLALARSCGEVASMDMTRERLLSLKSLADLEGMHNITFVHGGDAALPFPDGHFDAIVLNGVLEWVPENRAGRPREVQVQFLREAARLLTLDGIIYVAIENRLAARYLRKREDHTSLYWSSFMPRPMSDAYSRAVRKQPYRTYTYSSRGYRRLFREAGLPFTQLVCPLPNYRFPTRLANLESDRDWPADGGLTTASQHFAHSFSILGSRAPKPNGLHAVLAVLKERLGETSLRCEQYAIGRSAAFLTLAGANGRRYACRLPYGKAESTRAQGNVSALGALRDSQWNLGVEVPQALADGAIGLDYYSVESFVEGAAQRPVVDTAFLPTLSGVAEFCSALGLASRGTASSAEVAETTRQRAAAVAGRLLDLDLRRDFERVSAQVVNRVAGEAWATVWTHGSLGLDSGRWGGAGRSLTGVVGWELLDTRGLPGWDLLSFFSDLRVRTRGQRYRSAISDMLGAGLSVAESALWNAYARELGLPTQPTPALMGTFWLKGLDDHLSAGLQHLDRAWIERNVRPVVAATETALAAGRR